MEKPRQNMTSPFTVIAMKDIKDKKTAKEGSLSDLFKCVESLVSSHESLQQYAESIAASGGGAKEKLDGHLKMLGQVEQGLIELAQERISGIGTAAVPAVPPPTEQEPPTAPRAEAPEGAAQ